jgi:phytoene desaturase
MAKTRKAIVIGSGIAGIAMALRLRHKGYSTEVFEANAYAGGKIHAFDLKGYRFDAGPSLFTMPFLVDELFQLFGLNPSKYFKYQQQKTICNYFWDDDMRFTASASLTDFIEQASKTFDTDPIKIEQYLTSNRRKYELTAPLFLEKSLHKLSTYFSRQTLKAISKLSTLHVFSTLHEVNASYFSNPRLVQLFNRYATYNGSSPYKTPGIMSMIPHLEMSMGTYYPEGGMHSISQSLYKLALEQGVVFHFNKPVSEIVVANRIAKGVVVNDVQYEADLVVSNMDVYGTYTKLLKGIQLPSQVAKQERSSSALIFYWGIRKQFPELDLHNIFFSSSYKKEFESIFEGETLLDDPTVYINITSKREAHAPAGCENWFVMINAPANQGQDWEKLKQAARDNIIRKLSKILKTDIEPLIETEDILDPCLIESRTSSIKGSLYGTSSNSRYAAFLRHPNFSNNVSSLYFCGGSVHPGGGIPLCLLSAKISSQLIPSA